MGHVLIALLLALACTTPKVQIGHPLDDSCLNVCLTVAGLPDTVDASYEVLDATVTDWPTWCRCEQPDGSGQWVPVGVE